MGSLKNVTRHGILLHDHENIFSNCTDTIE